MLLNLANKNRDDKIMTLYKQAKNYTNHMICKTKQDFNIETFKNNKNNPQALWDQMRATTSTTTSVGPRLSKGPTSDKVNANEVADSFNKHFTNIVTKYKPDINYDQLPDYSKLKDFVSQHKPNTIFVNIPATTHLYSNS